MPTEYLRRRRFKFCFALGCVLVLIATVSWFWQNRQENWISVSRDQWAELRAEEAVYQSSETHQVFVRCQLLNRSAHSLRLDLADAENFRISEWQVYEGTHFAPMREGMQQIALGFRMYQQDENDPLNIACRAGKLTILKPGARVEFYRTISKTDRAAILRAYQNHPLWERAKILWPNAPNLLHFILRLDRVRIFPDGQCKRWQNAGGNITAFSWPLRWKTLPAES